MPKKTALVVIDMLNSYDHEDSDKLAESVEQTLPRMVDLVKRAKDEDVLVIYVNDNFGAWTESREQLIADAKRGKHPELVDPIVPDDETAFVFKARHSAFYQTPLEYLLGSEDIDRVVLIGQATEQCILYSALDAYIRHFQVAVPTDAVAHIQEHLVKPALEMMERNMDAEVAQASEIELS